MTFNDFSILLKGCVSASNKFYLILNNEEVDELPNSYGVEFSNGERYMFYSFKDGDYRAEFFLNNIFVDNSKITAEFYSEFYKSILVAVNEQS